MKSICLLMAVAILYFGFVIGSAQLHEDYFSVPVILSKDDEINMTIDFSVIPEDDICIGDSVWSCLKGDGQNQNCGGSEGSEISGSEVFLFDSDGEAVIGMNTQRDSGDEIEAPSPCTGAIGDFVWWDLNRDGVQNEDESGVPAVGIELHTGSEGSRLIDCTVTDMSGHYVFDGLCSGVYEVRLRLGSLPEGSLVAIPSFEYDDSIDSD